jgi:hypothetical protein
VLAQGADPGFNTKKCTKKTPTTGPFGNNCKAGKVSLEVEARGVTGCKCLSLGWDTDL